MINTEKIFVEGNNRYFAQIDEQGDVYGCKDESQNMVRCEDCQWVGCPQRGKNYWEEGDSK